MNGDAWTERTVAHLRDLWAEGHSTAEIARRMGLSKNSVLGKVHRLHLAARASPIIRRDPSQPALAPRVPRSVTRPVGSTLPPLSTQLPLAPERAPRVIYAAPRPAPAQAVEIAPSGRVLKCSWPLGEPKTRAFRYCDVPSVPGKSFCAEHCARAYQKTHRQEHMEA